MKFAILVVVIFILVNRGILADTISTTSQDTEECHGRQCDRAAKFRMIANKLDRGMLSDMELDDELFRIMEESPRPGAYYSVGFETGMEPGLVYGKQTVYKFSSSLKLPMYMPGKRDYIIPDRKYRKPVLLQIIGDEKFDNIASLPTGVMSTYRSGGTDNQYLLFHHEGSKATCKDILKDKTIREFERWEKSVLIVPSNLMCAEVLGSKFDMVKGNIVKKELDVGGLAKTTYVLRAGESVF